MAWPSRQDTVSINRDSLSNANRPSECAAVRTTLRRASKSAANIVDCRAASLAPLGR
jgi:hypothetical protein